MLTMKCPEHCKMPPVHNTLYSVLWLTSLFYTTKHFQQESCLRHVVVFCGERKKEHQNIWRNCDLQLCSFRLWWCLCRWTVTATKKCSCILGAQTQWWEMETLKQSIGAWFDLTSDCSDRTRAVMYPCISAILKGETCVSHTVFTAAKSTKCNAAIRFSICNLCSHAKGIKQLHNNRSLTGDKTRTTGISGLYSITI